MHRRDFLRSTVAAAGLAIAARSAHAAQPGDERVLVLVELSGGNDGLNTLVPFSDPGYRRLRPKLALAADQILPLNEEMGLNQAMAPLWPAWQAGELAAIPGVGYAQPNRSHFRSIEIWDTASDSTELRQEGWISQVMREAAIDQGGTIDGVILSGGAGPLAGPALSALVLHRPQQFVAQAQRLESTNRPSWPKNRALAHILTVREKTRASAGRLAAGIAGTPLSTTGFPGTPLGRQFAMAAHLIKAGLPVKVVKISQSGFDTHAGQIRRHHGLLSNLAEALAAFRQVLISAGVWHRALVMTYSEFGRRAAENAAGGTDHGAAGAQFMLGGRVKGGIHGTQPSLEKLDNGDLEHRVDFRQLYATVSQRWWGLSRTPNALGQNTPLDLIA